MPRTDAPPGRRATAACIASSLTVWVVATLLRALDWRSFGPGHLVIGYLVYAADWTFVPCIGLGLPATAIALWLRSRSSARRAATAGFAVGAVGVTVFAVAFGAGTSALGGMALMLLILAAELWLAFKLRARSSRPSTA